MREDWKPFLPGRRWLRGPSQSIPALKEQPQGGWKLSIVKEPWGEDNGARGKSCTNTGFIMMQEFLTVRSVIHWNNLPRDVVESPSPKVFRMWLDRMEENLIWCPFPTKVGADDLSRSLPAWAVLGFFGSVIQFVHQESCQRGTCSATWSAWARTESWVGREEM